MGTKTNPGIYDCHAKAAPDEPLFTLVARDPLAAKLVEIWAALRGHNFTAAEVFFYDAVALAKALPGERPDKLREAFELAGDMDDWRDRQSERAKRGDAA